MIYLEDYIELIEQLPADLRDRFTDMRELDLKVQNKIDALDGRVRRFFADARADPKSEALAPEYESMHTCYEQALEDADEKVSIASRIYELVERHLRKLDQELGKFKLELEADCSGITEILERRSLMYDENGDSSTSDKLKRKLDPVLLNGSSTARSSFSHPLGASYPPSNGPTVSSSPRNPSTSSHGLGSHSNAALSKVPSKSSLPSSKSNPSMKELQCGRGAQASLKAMSAAQKKAEQLGNKLNLSGLLGSSPSSSSLSKPLSSYTDVTAGSSGSGSGGSYLPSMSSTPPSLSSQQKSIVSSSLHGGVAGSRSNMPKVSRRGQKTISSSHTNSTSSLPSMMQTSSSNYPEPSLDWVPDPNEPTYCLCGQVSYGEMVGCDNASCAVEWFHYGCVGLTDAPKGKWYCPDCTAQIKKRRAR